MATTPTLLTASPAGSTNRSSATQAPSANTDVVDDLPTLLEQGVVPTEFHQHYKQLYDQQKKAASGTIPEWSPAELLDLFTCF